MAWLIAAMRSNKAIEDFTQLAQKLNQASTRVDGILAKVDTMVSGDESRGCLLKLRRRCNPSVRLLIT